ncbi:hypothetical protein BCV70DRAFT_203290 [Testicularia cyperi]|uniref:Uncharacterized protein n=1 Tax=Testicularia cyperi TaxID=1882483 RepID=A0A317XHJ8_9BASI|nr:hypothetical protein BCV70DRAFT_203290 [Testicularia cyperi]
MSSPHANFHSSAAEYMQKPSPQILRGQRVTRQVVACTAQHPTTSTSATLEFNLSTCQKLLLRVMPKNPDMQYCVAFVAASNGSRSVPTT